MHPYTVQDYVNYCVLLPLAFQAASLALCLALQRPLRRRVRYARETHTSVWANPVSTAALLLGAVLGGTMAAAPVAILWFTAPAALHTQAPEITIQGTVEGLSRMPFPLPGPQGLTHHATIRVGGTEYYCFEAQDLASGDEITLQCPESTRVITGYKATHVPRTPEPPLRELHFSRELYLQSLFWTPVRGSVLLLAMLIWTVIFKKKDGKPFPPWQTAVQVAGFLLFLLLVTAPLARGLPLLSQEESDAVTARGVITALTPADGGMRPMRFHTDYGICFGWELTIQGQTYLIPTAGDLAPGDEVIFSYLPRSRCILECAAVSP